MPLKERGFYRFDEFELDPASRTFSRNGAPIPLYPKAFEVLIFLVANPGRVVTKEEIFQAVWPDSFVEETNLARQVSSLRRALGDRASCIVTVPGRGYQFAARVEEQPSTGAEPIDSEQHGQTEEILVQRVRERTEVVIEESFPAPVTETAVRRLPMLTRIPRWVPWSLLGLVVVGAAATYLWMRFSKPPELRKVLVADFLNLTGDPTFDLTLKSALVAGIGQTPWLQIMGAGEANNALTAMEKPLDTPLLGDTALEVCRRAGYQAMLRPRLESSPDQAGYRMSMDVVNCGTGGTLATYSARARNKDEILGMMDSLSLRARRKLGEPNKSLDEFQVPFYNVTTSSYEALLVYFQGVGLGRQGKYQEAIPYFQKAADLDSKFAWAQSALGVTYYNLGDRAQAASYAEKAFNLSANVSQYERLYIRYTYYLNTLHDLNATEKEVQEWTRVYPDDMTAWEALTDVDNERGDFPRAIEAGEHAMQLTVARAPSTFENLARAYQRSNRFGDAKRVLAEAHAQGIESDRFHDILFSIAAVQHDAQAMQQEIDWSKSKSKYYAAQGDLGILAADEGKYRQFEELFSAAIPEVLKRDGAENADSMLWEETRIEAALGRTDKAKELLRQTKNHSEVYSAVIEASAGDEAAAEVYLKKPELYPHGTIEHFVHYPEVRAILALRHHDPTKAISELEQASPYELATPEVIELRGNAYLAAKQGEKAEREFRKLIANPGLEDPIHPWTIYAHVGLARALLLEGNKSGSKTEYERFFALWNDADSDVPALQQARRDFAQMR
jgi:eukaryotic-like serine/threonine-protein kinase